jgi:hypothetical protein
MQVPDCDCDRGCGCGRVCVERVPLLVVQSVAQSAHMRERERRARMPLLVPASHRHLFRQQYELPTAVKPHCGTVHTVNHLCRTQQGCSWGRAHRCGAEQGLARGKRPCKGQHREASTEWELDWRGGCRWKRLTAALPVVPCATRLHGWMQQA